MANQTSQRACTSCEAWHPSNKDAGKCRRLAPAKGWPTTYSQDWCLEFIPKTAPVLTSDLRIEPLISCLALNYQYAARYPEAAQQWLDAARKSETPPKDLRVMLEEPLAGHVTREMPTLSATEDDADALHSWSLQWPGACNDPGGSIQDELYESILIDISHPNSKAANDLALRELPSSHPWRQL